jgi:hypothetical protein
MKKLEGGLDAAHTAARQELMEAGLGPEELLETYVADVTLGGGVRATLTRQTESWKVLLNAKAPYELARRIDETWGERVRFRGTKPGYPLKEGEEVVLWVASSMEGLKALLEILKGHFGRGS